METHKPTTTANTKTVPRIILARVFLAISVAVSLGSSAVLLAIYNNPPAATTAAADEVHWTFTSPTSVTLSWRGGSSQVQYGVTTTYSQTATGVTPNPVPPSSSGPFYEAKITGLQTNTTYHYSVGAGDHTFRTPRTGLATGESFVVAAQADIGDAGTYPNVAIVQDQIAAMHPELVITPGDLTYGNARCSSPSNCPAVDRVFNDVMGWSQDAAFFPAWGNHEWDKTSDDLRNYKGRFDFPNPKASPGSSSFSTTGGGEDWYWFDYGNTRFIAYPEPYVSATWTDWKTAAEPLFTEAQSNAQISFIVTFGHRPAYSSGHHPGSDTLKAILDTFGTKYNKYVLSLEGHSHNYERTNPQSGVVHITTGTGGSSLETDAWSSSKYPNASACASNLWLSGCPAPSYSAKRFMRHGAIKLEFTSTGIQGSFICGPAKSGSNDVACNVGDVLDTFAIGQPGTVIVPPKGGIVTDASKVFGVPQVERPAYLIPKVDPTFETTITRIAGDAGSRLAVPTKTSTWSTDARQHYSKDQPWNATGTLLALQNERIEDASVVYLDGATYQPKYVTCPEYSPNDDRWHPSPAHANERINVIGNIVEFFDVTTCDQVKKIDLGFTANGFGTGEGNPSADGRYLALSNESNTALYIVDTEQSIVGPPVVITSCGLANCAVDWVSISPSGKYAVVNYKGDHPRVFDINPSNLALIPRAIPSNAPQCDGHLGAQGYIYDLGHADMALNPFDGNKDVIIGQRRDWCNDEVGQDKNGKPIGWVVLVSLEDGTIMSLTDPTNEAQAHHISTRNNNRLGWVYVGYYPASGKRFNDEVVAIKIDGTQKVERLAHKHGATTGCYRCESHAVPSRDGQRVIFASNWSLNCANGCGSSSDIKAYVVDTGAPRPGEDPPADTIAPTVSVTTPVAGAVISAATTLSATADDNIKVVGVQFLVDGQAVGSEDTSAPYAMSWNPTEYANGTHTISARARDQAANNTTSATVSITTQKIVIIPGSVTLIKPVSGANLSGNVSMQAITSDIPSVAGVQFKVDGQAIGSEDTATPFEAMWDTTTTTKGTHLLAAIARDANQKTYESRTISVNVDNTPPPPPTSSETLTFASSDDTYIRRKGSKKNYGRSKSMNLDGAPEERDLLIKFQVQGVNGRRVTSAKISLYTESDGSRESGGNFYRISSSDWQERTVTWANAPRYEDTKLGTITIAKPKTRVEVELKTVITGDGTYSFRVKSKARDGLLYSTKESKKSANRPKLIVQVES